MDNIKDSASIDIKCRACGTIKSQLTICGHWKNVVCNKCTGHGIHRSKGEDQIAEFLVSHGIEYESNISFVGRSEVDIYIKSHNLAIEYDGILWHSVGTTYPNNAVSEKIIRARRINKQKKLSERGIHLVTIFENEWNLKRDIVKSILLAKLSIFERKIFARKCSVRAVSVAEQRDFLEENHLQGYAPGSISLGLFHNGLLIALASFSKRSIGRGCRNDNMELIRFCVKKYTSAVGGLSKLISHAKTIVNVPIISYCDKRYSNGRGYISAGFKLLRETPPNYFYTKNCILLESRHKYQKHKLVAFNSYTTSKTESQIMYEAKYRKIYDCGNMVFII
jgi:hypothetical protein